MRSTLLSSTTTTAYDGRGETEGDKAGRKGGSIVSISGGNVKVEQKVKMTGPFADMIQERLRRRNEL
jgi:hypothetical protein